MIGGEWKRAGGDRQSPLEPYRYLKDVLERFANTTCQPH
jgi:hypothetical protein